MKAITIEDLKTKFVVAKVAPYGEVIMVPGGDFDPDWEAQLEDLGFGCVFTEINGEKFTLVRLEKEEGEEESTAEPRPVLKREDSGKFARRGAPSGQKMNPWNDDDEERLLKRIEELPGFLEEKVARLVQEFPGRTATGLLKKYQKLTHGKKRRSIGRPRRDAPEEKVESAPKGDLEDTPKGRSAEPVSWVDAAAKLDIVKMLAKIESDVAALSALGVKYEKHHNILVRLHSAVVMQSLEVLERQGALVIPAALRKHYAKALVEPNTQYADLFIAKCEVLLNGLLEASS